MHCHRRNTLILHPKVWLPAQTSPHALSLQFPPCWQHDRWDVEAFVTSTSKQRRWCPPKIQATVSLFILPCSTVEDTLAGEESVSERWPQCFVWPELSGNTTNGSSVLLLHLDSASCLLPFLVSSLSPLCWPLLSVIVFFAIIPLVPLLTPSLFLPLPAQLVFCMSLFSRFQLFFHPMSLSLLVSMSFWPWSHFPNWLSGSLIILRHPCCRLFYLSACRRPNPLISKYPSSAHIALQQTTAFLVYFSTVHTDSLYTLHSKE